MKARCVIQEPRFSQEVTCVYVGINRHYYVNDKIFFKLEGEDNLMSTIASVLKNVNYGVKPKVKEKSIFGLL